MTVRCTECIENLILVLIYFVYILEYTTYLTNGMVAAERF